jgi:hypothetical protein
LYYALTLRGRNIIYNPYPTRVIYPNRRTLEKGQKAQKTKGTSLFRFRRTFFLTKKKKNIKGSYFYRKRIRT